MFVIITLKYKRVVTPIQLSSVYNQVVIRCTSNLQPSITYYEPPYLWKAAMILMFYKCSFLFYSTNKAYINN